MGGARGLGGGGASRRGVADDIDLWEAHADWWQEGFTDGADPEYTEQILPMAFDELSGFERILDIGCGDGQISRMMAAAGSPAAVRSSTAEVVSLSGAGKGVTK